MPDHTSVYMSEILVILWVLWWLEKSKPKSLLICSEYLAALDVFIVYYIL